MPGHYCFVCASNEGVFLEVTLDNRSSFSDQVKTCLSAKISESINLSNKICYKCAYELDQCTKFVQKYKKSHEVLVSQPKTSMPCCFLCYDLVESDRIFDITKDNSVTFNPLRKIRSIFNLSKANGDSKFICLTCRYNLDVLYDLKRIYQETIVNLKALINEEISYSDFPKEKRADQHFKPFVASNGPQPVHTDVVNRKTTITTFPDITFYGSINSDSDSIVDNMPRTKRRGRGRPRRNEQNNLRTIKSKARSCDKCRSSIANSIDMYRFYRTGQTVCKNCWITMDPSGNKPLRRSRQGQSSLAETKLCAVFLTDVLSEESQKKEKEKEVKGDNTSCSSSQEEAKFSENSARSVSFKTRNHIVNGKARRGRKRRIGVQMSSSDVERTPAKVTRLSKEREDSNERKSEEASGDAEPQTSTHLPKKRGRKRRIDRNSDSDESLLQREKLRFSSNDHVNKTNTKKQKSTVEETTSNARSDSSDGTSNEDNIGRRGRMRSATSPSTSFAKKGDRNTRSRTRSSSISSTEMAPSTEFKSPKSPTQSEVKTKYTCDKCNKTFDTKLSNAKHRLTHLKQAELKLEKLAVPSVKEKQESELEQSEAITEKATSHSNRTVSGDKRADDPSDDVIAINIEDDTDDEEFFSMSGEENEKKKEKEISDESSNVIDKPDEVKSESRIQEEPANDESNEVTESEKCKKSTIAPDETLEIGDDDDRENKDTKDEPTMNNEDKAASQRSNDKSKDNKKSINPILDHENVNEAKDKNVEVENNTEVASAEEKKTISDLDEATTCDNEMIKSTINTVDDNEDHSESYQNIFEHNCKDGQDEIIEEPEMQCNLTNESLTKDTKESEEKDQQIPPTDTLSNKNVLDEIIGVNDDQVEELEKRQNSFDEGNAEVETIVHADEPNDAADTLKPDLSNGEKYDEIRDKDVMIPINCDSDEDDVIPVNCDSNDEANYKDVTEETIPIDDPKEKSKLEEELKELEDLVEDNAMNNKYGVQENSTYVPDDNSTDAANEILKEVFDLAAAEVQQREDSSNIINTKTLDEVEMETLENISREIRKSADMPSLDPISVMEIDDVNDITLN